MVTNWAKCILGEVITLQRGHDLTEGERRVGSVPVIGSAGQNGWHDVALAPGPGVTVGRSGASAGVVTYVREPYWPHNTCLYVKDFKGNDPRFVAYMLQTMPLAELNSGSAQPSLNRNFLYPLPVRLPDPDTQRRIAGILGAYDDLIEVNRRRVAVLEAMARGLFEEWFVRFRFPGHEKHPLQDSPNGPLPEGWRWGQMAEIAEQAGRSINPASFPDETFAHYSLPAFDAGQAPTPDLGSTIMSNKLAFASPAVLISKLNPRIPRIWHALEPSEYRQVASTEFVPLAPKTGFSTATIATVAGSPWFTDRLIGMAGGTSTSHQRVRPADILAAPLPMPGDDLLLRADRLLQPMLAEAANLRAANHRLAAARDLLLPRLISGQIDVGTAERQLETAA